MEDYDMYYMYLDDDMDEQVGRKKEDVSRAYSNELKNCTILDNETIYEKFEEYKKVGKKSTEWLKIRDQIVKSNLRYACLISKNVYKWFISAYHSSDINLDDFIQEWNYWLIYAVEHYSPESWRPFFAYFKPCIAFMIYNYIINNSKYFSRQPRWSAKELREFTEKFYNENWIDPDTEDLEEFIKTYNDTHAIPMSKEYIKFYTNYLLHGVISLEQPAENWIVMGIDSDTTRWERAFLINSDNTKDSLIDTLYDPESCKQEDFIRSDSLKKELKKTLSLLTYREQDILTLYFWLDWEDPMTLEEIGEKFDLTRERVRQIKERALRRLRWKKRLLNNEKDDETILGLINQANILRTYLDEDG